MVAAAEEPEKTEIIENTDAVIESEEKADEKEPELEDVNLEEELVGKASSIQASSQPTKKSEKKIKKKNIESTSVKDRAYNHALGEAEPQPSFLGNYISNDYDCMKDDGYRVLAWNMVGTVALRKTPNYTSVDVSFCDRNVHRDFSLNDDFSSNVASLSYGGLVLASKGKVQDLDQYDEDDDLIDDKKQVVDKNCSYIYFKSFKESKTTSFGSPKEWHYKLPKGENVELVAQGSGWVAALTDLGYIRVFTTDGIQTTIMQTNPNAVTMVGYENMLAVFEHTSLPIYDQQVINYRIIDCGSMVNPGPASYKTLMNGVAYLSQNSCFDWVGFSEEGQLMTYSDTGIVSSLNMMNGQWTPVLTVKEKFPEFIAKCWICGFSEKEMFAIPLPRGSEQPPLKMKSKSYKLSVPTLKTDRDSEDLAKLNEIDSDLMLRQLHMQHEKFRMDNWASLKDLRGENDTEKHLSAGILDENAHKALKREEDKAIINAIRLCITTEEHEKIFSYFNMLNYTKSLKLAIQLCEKLGQANLASRLNVKFSDMETRMKLEQQKQAAQQKPKQAFDSRQMANVMDMASAGKPSAAPKQENPIASELSETTVNAI